MKTLWMAANITGYEWLKEAQKIPGVNVTDIITLSEDAKTVMYDGVDREVWDEFGIPVHEIEKTNDELNLIKEINPECIVVGGWRQLVGKEILEIPKKGVIGFHPTMLPKGRGPSPIINSIVEGVTDSGLTMFYYNSELDAGEIIGQQPFLIGDHDYAWDVYQKEVSAGKRLNRKFLPMIAKGNAPRVPQEQLGNPTYFPKRDIATFNKLDLETEDTSSLYKKIRALSQYNATEKGGLSYRGAWLPIGEKRLRIWRAEPIKYSGSENPGEIVQTEYGTLLKTKDGYLKLGVVGTKKQTFDRKALSKISKLEDLTK